MKLRILLSLFLLAGACYAPVASVGAPNVPEATPATTPPPKRFNFVDIRRRAEVLANQPYQDPTGKLPDFLAKLDYDQYRDIRFKGEKSLWRDSGLPFEIQFAPLGFLFNRQVTINVVSDGESKPAEYANDLFDYGRNAVPDNLPKDLGFAGFKVLYPLHLSLIHI